MTARYATERLTPCELEKGSSLHEKARFPQGKIEPFLKQRPAVPGKVGTYLTVGDLPWST